MNDRIGKPMSVGELLRAGLAGQVRTPEQRAARERQHARDTELAAAMAEKRMADTFGLHVHRCGAPERTVREVSRDLLADTTALQKARTWMAGDESHLLLSGGTGAGKSLAAAWTLRLAKRIAAWGHLGELEWDENGAMWMPFGKLCRLSAYDEVDQYALRRAHRVRILVLDDVGTGDADTLKAHEKQRLEELADERDAEGRRTVWTTNLGIRPAGTSPSPFAEYIGRRAYSRLVRSVCAVDCGNRDLRREGRRAP